MQTTRLPRPKAASPSSLKPLLLTKRAARPRRLLLDLTVKGVQFSDAYRVPLPFGCQKIDVTAKLEAAIDLFPAKAERFLRRQSEGVEQVLEKCLVCVTSSLGSE